MKDLVLEYRDALQTRLAALALEGGIFDAEHLMDSIYTTVAKSSFHKTFNRDRRALAKQGIFIEEVYSGRAKRWSLDEQATRADLSGLSKVDARTVAELGRATLNNLASGSKVELGCAVARVGRGLAGSTGDTGKQLNAGTEKAFRHLQEALGTKKPCRFMYQSKGAEEPDERIFCPWGFFEYAGELYAVGKRIKGGEEAMRTYRLSRATSATVLLDEDSYEVDKNFNVSDYRFLPFEISAETPEGKSRRIRLYVPPASSKLFRDKVRKRGGFEEHADGSLTWTHYARSIKRAASWAIEAGGIPLEPAELKDEWKRILTAATQNPQKGEKDA